MLFFWPQSGHHSNLMRDGGFLVQSEYDVGWLHRYQHWHFLADSGHPFRDDGLVACADYSRFSTERFLRVSCKIFTKASLTVKTVFENIQLTLPSPLQSASQRVLQKCGLVRLRWWRVVFGWLLVEPCQRKPLRKLSSRQRVRDLCRPIFFKDFILSTVCGIMIAKGNWLTFAFFELKWKKMRQNVQRNQPIQIIKTLEKTYNTESYRAGKQEEGS